MKFNCSIEIAAPVDFTANIFAHRENQKHWHDDLESIENVSGEPGTVGAQSKLTFTKFQIIETITVNRLPSEFTGEYLTEGICWNTMKNEFHSLGDKTRYDVEVEYKMIAFFLKIMRWVMPGMFKKQVVITMEKFKAFVESEYQNRHN